jgi:hypothetical protein
VPRKGAALAALRAVQCQFQSVIGGETLTVITKTVRVYSVAKTIADTFKYRNKIGLDVALEALREAWRARRFTMDKVYLCARICRVERVMRPYLEILVA